MGMINIPSMNITLHCLEETIDAITDLSLGL